MRMLVLLLRSGHTAKIALRENDLCGRLGPTVMKDFLESLEGLAVYDMDVIDFAYVHDQQAGMDVASMADNDESRIISNNPGEES
jgi:hypothetical protein